MVSATMAIIPLLVTLAIFGAVLYLITLIPMDPTIRKVITIVAVIAVVLWLLETFGLLGGGGPRVNWRGGF